MGALLSTLEVLLGMSTVLLTKFIATNSLNWQVRTRCDKIVLNYMSSKRYKNIVFLLSPICKMFGELEKLYRQVMVSLYLLFCWKIWKNNHLTWNWMLWSFFDGYQFAIRLYCIWFQNYFHHFYQFYIYHYF